MAVETQTDIVDDNTLPLFKPRPRITGKEALLPDVWDDSIEPLTEVDMPEASLQFLLVSYLASVLRWYFQPHDWFVIGNIAIYPPGARERYDHIDPDLAVFVGLPTPEHNVRSWRIRPPDHPAPTVAFEIASDSTWRADLETKPAQYARMGVAEYYAYDPDTPRIWKRVRPRLKGWRLENGQAVEMQPDAQGRLWSAALNSYLVADGAWLRLTDTNGVRRLTEKEAAALAASEAMSARAEILDARAESDALRAKIRALGFDPDSL